MRTTDRSLLDTNGQVEPQRARVATVPSATTETLTTRTEGEPASDTSGESELGILWVSPIQRFDVLVDSATLGRDPSCGIVLPSAEVSRVHAQLRREGRFWRLRDLGSKNGTCVDGMKQGLSPLEPQSVVRLGEWVGGVCLLPASRDPSTLFHEMIPGFLLGPAGVELFQVLRKLAPLEIPVLVQGETGTGKELVAQALHRWSLRPGRIVALNCAAIPDSVAEAELFGVRRGAFTGAHQNTTGYIASANRGTLFLDEVLDLPKAVQTKLLRVLEERKVTPVGDTEPTHVDFRLIAASQEPLEQVVQEGHFRRDLHARLSGAELKLLPLRHRREEVLPIFELAWAKHHPTPPQLEPRLIEALCLHPWRSNVRELVQLARLMAASGKLRLDLQDLPAKYREVPTQGSHDSAGEVHSETPNRRSKWLTRHGAELAQLHSALEATHGNLSEAARRTGIPRYRARRLLEAASEIRVNGSADQEDDT